MVHQQKFREPPAVGHAEKGVGRHVRCPLVCANKFQLKIISGPLCAVYGQKCSKLDRNVSGLFVANTTRTGITYFGYFLLFLIINKAGVCKQI